MEGHSIASVEHPRWRHYHRPLRPPSCMA